MADVYDNFIFYVQHKNNPEIKRCKTLVTLIEKYKPEDWNDTIFKKLVEINNYSYMDMNQKSFEFLDRVDRKNNLKI
jgi:hypothetical protein